MTIKNTTSENLFRVKSRNGVIRCLKSGVDINTCNNKGQTALFTCNVPAAIQAMIDAGIDIHHLDNDGNNALFYAQNTETVERLVRHGINVNHRNKSGNLAIQHIDVSPGLIKYLIKAGLDIQAKDRSGNSFLCIPFDGYVYDALAEAGCNLNHKNNNKNKNGQTAFDYWQAGNCHMAGADTHWGAIKDDYICFLMRNIHLKDGSPLLFKLVTLKSLALMKLLTQKGMAFKINEKCIIGATTGNVKDVITTLKTLTDISYVMFYTEYGFPLPRYAGKSLIKWLIRNDIKIDMGSLKERCIYDEISQYKSKREDSISSESKRQEAAL